MSSDIWTDFYTETYDAGSGANPNPFTLKVWDKNLNRQGFLGNPISVKVIPRHNAVGTLELVLPVSHPKLGLVTAHGSRITCDYRGEQIFSGIRRPIVEQGLTATGTVTILYEDDIRLLWRLMGYPTPANAVDTQPDLEDKRTGPAEDVLKGFISANVGRDTTKTITVVPSSHRGSAITVGVRMVPLADKLADVIDQAGIGLSVRQIVGGLQVDCYEPVVYPRTLSEAGGSIIDGSWSEEAPTATGTVIGGPNTGTSREFKRVDDAARAAEWGDWIEVLTDASSQTLLADILAAGQKTLDAAGPTAGFKLALSETKTFHYGGADGVHVGDQITVDLFGQTRTDVLREASLTWDRSNGLRIEPVVGEHTADPDRALMKMITRLARAVRALRAT